MKHSNKVLRLYYFHATLSHECVLVCLCACVCYAKYTYIRGSSRLLKLHGRADMGLIVQHVLSRGGPPHPPTVSDLGVFFLYFK